LAAIVSRNTNDGRIGAPVATQRLLRLLGNRHVNTDCYCTMSECLRDIWTAFSTRTGIFLPMRLFFSFWSLVWDEPGGPGKCSSGIIRIHGSYYLGAWAHHID